MQSIGGPHGGVFLDVLHEGDVLNMRGAARNMRWLNPAECGPSPSATPPGSAKLPEVENQADPSLAIPTDSDVDNTYSVLLLNVFRMIVLTMPGCSIQHRCPALSSVTAEAWGIRRAR